MNSNIRPGFTPYVPPHKRNPSSQSTKQTPRTLDDIVSSPFTVKASQSKIIPILCGWQAVVNYSRDTVAEKLDAESCLFRVMEGETQNDDDDDDIQVLIWRGVLEYEAIEFLQWCRKQKRFSNGFEIVFPPDLSKEERALWHHAATNCELNSASKGIGDSRKLTVGFNAIKQEKKMSISPLSLETKLKIERVYNACQRQGGRTLRTSRNEITEFVIDHANLSDVEILKIFLNV